MASLKFELHFQLYYRGRDQTKHSSINWQVAFQNLPTPTQ